MKCSDCNGTGKYVGFTTTEACKACNGTGEIDDSGPQMLEKLIVKITAAAAKRHWEIIGLDRETTRMPFVGTPEQAARKLPADIPPRCPNDEATGVPDGAFEQAEKWARRTAVIDVKGPTHWEGIREAVSPQEYLVHCLGYTDEQAEAILKAAAN